MNVIEKKYPVSKKGKSSLSQSPENSYSENVVGLIEEVGEKPRSADGLRVSEEEYWGKYYHEVDVKYEWNNGVLEEKPMADYLSSQMYRWFFSLLQEYLRTHPVARLICLDIGFRLALTDKTSIRKPDLALILHANPITIAGEDCTYHGIFDLCIEFLSGSTPSEAERDTVVKKQEYCQAGVKEYFILDREGKKTAFYLLTEKGRYAHIPLHSGDVIQSEVLPGFQFRVEDLYTQPPLLEKINDSVYSSFIFREYQESEKRAERFAARLRTLGVDPDQI